MRLILKYFKEFDIVNQTKQMKKTTLLFIAILLCTNIMAQYEKIDSYVKELDFKRNTSITEMADKITAKSSTEKEKLRAIFVWISHNIDYDVRAFRSGKIPNSDALEVVLTKRAVCQGYSNLFEALAEAVGIETFLVSGFSKGYGFEDRKKLENADHAWNAVYVDGDWHLIDATWGAGHINHRGVYVPRMQEKYFMANPLFFITEHLPEDPVWQMLPCPIKPHEYLKDSAEIRNRAANKQKCYSYQDTLQEFMKLDSLQQRIASARRMVDYFPENEYSPAILYNQAAYYYSLPLNDKSIALDEKKVLAKKSLRYYKKAEAVLKNAREPHKKQLRQMVQQNISNVEKFLDFYKNK